MKPSVAVITTTIGSDELEKAISSIKAQTYPCTHYVFVDGKEHWHKVKPLEAKYPNVIFTFFPMNTGGKNNIGNGAIHAILPYLLQEDIFCFLDDDNWHYPDYIEHLVNLIEQYELDYAYSLRHLYDRNYRYLCEDNSNSLGFWSIQVSVPFQNGELAYDMSNNLDWLIDTNSYAITRNTAFQLSEQWYSGISNDRAVFAKLKAIGACGGFTGKRTTHYKLIPIFDQQVLNEAGAYDIIIKQKNHLIC